MPHVKPLLIKFLIYSLIIRFVLLFFGFLLSSLLILSALLSIVTYVLGDRIVFPLKGNWFAAVMNGVIVFLGILIWIGPSNGLYFSTIGGALFVAFVVAVCEWFIHSYVISKINREDRDPIYD